MKKFKIGLVGRIIIAMILGMLLGVPIAAALYRLLKEDVLRRENQAK